MNRRQFLGVIGITGLNISGCRYWPETGLMNKCTNEILPHSFLEHELVQEAWSGVNAENTWDCHCHLIGTGDNNSGIWVNPDMTSLTSPVQYTQFKFYLNASCVDQNLGVDKSFVNRLLFLKQSLPAGFKFMLLAFDYHYDKKGKRVLEHTAFHTPNEYTAQIANQHPEHFEWIASIHPYREDCVDALTWAVKQGARAVKWLPPAMGMNPDSPLCDNFYMAMKQFNIPLLTHTGDEYAVAVPGSHDYGNPLLLRRALDHGVKVIMAHCASLGKGQDFDQGENGKLVSNYELFKRLMNQPQYEKQLFGDISAVTQINHGVGTVTDLIRHQEFHDRLLYGTDYPLPGVMPVISTKPFVSEGYLTKAESEVLVAIKAYNPVLFDFMLKRLIRVDGKAFLPGVFETRKHFVS